MGSAINPTEEIGLEICPCRSRTERQTQFALQLRIARDRLTQRNNIRRCRFRHASATTASMFANQGVKRPRNTPFLQGNATRRTGLLFRAIEKRPDIRRNRHKTVVVDPACQRPLAARYIDYGKCVCGKVVSERLSAAEVYIIPPASYPSLVVYGRKDGAIGALVRELHSSSDSILQDESGIVVRAELIVVPDDLAMPVVAARTRAIRIERQR